MTKLLFIPVFFFILLSPIINAQYRNMVFEGAGIRGIAYGGVIQVFEENNLMDDIKNVGGTSAGAITALTVSLGYKSSEINELIYTTDFNKFNDGQYFFIGGIHRVKEDYGWYKGDAFQHWLEEIIKKKTNNADITFKELHDKGYKDLYITATCLNKQKLFVFSYKNYPAMKVKDAVRISMSIPLYFGGVLIDNNGKVYEKQNEKQSLDLVMDGGIIGNFPIFIFDSVIKNSPKGKDRIINSKTIGIRIDSDEQIKQDSTSAELQPLPINNLSDYFMALYVFVLENLNRNQLVEDDWKRTISVSSLDIGPRIKKLSNDQKNRLINSGVQSAKSFLAHTR